MKRKKAFRELHFAKTIARKQPFSLLLQVTNRCNMTCSFCDFWSNGVHPSKELTVHEIEDLSEQLSLIGCFLISIEGGEPLLRPDIVDIVKVLAKHHLPILYTNGWKISAKLAAQLFSAGLHQIGVSIDFHIDSKHDQKRGMKDATDRAWAAIHHLKNAAPRGARQVHVMTVLMAENQDSWEPLLELSREQGVCHAFTLLSTAGFRRKGDQDQLPPPSSQLQKLWKRYPHILLPRSYLFNAERFLHHQPLPRCWAGFQSFNIDHLGNVSPCIEKIDESVGNIRETALIELLSKLREKDAGKGCQDCWTLCRGMAQSLGQGGSLSSWWDMFTRLRI